MKRRISLLLVMMLMALSVVACGNKTKENEMKDVTILLGGLGGELTSIKALGELPEPQVNGQKLFFNTKDTKGYFSGFNLGLGLEEDLSTVNMIYIQSYGESKIQVNNFVIGSDVSGANTAFGKGELVSEEQNGKIMTYMNYQNDQYNIECTVENNKVTAISFTSANKEKKAIEEISNQDDQVLVTIETPDIEEESIEISILWTIPEIIEALGDDYVFATEESGAYYEYWSSLEYDDILFSYDHDDKELNKNALPGSIFISSNKYKLKGFDVKIGDSYKDAWEYADGKLEHGYDYHNDQDIFNMFYFVEDDSTYYLSFSTDPYKEYNSKADLDDAPITGVSLFIPID